jgi:hypothetical protein
MAEGLPALSVLEAEVMDMWDVLLGREPSPVNERRTDAMLEVANAYFARASEIAALILKAEREGNLVASSGYSRFRKGELRLFMDVATKTADMGSRRITMKSLQMEAERTGRERQ